MEAATVSTEMVLAGAGQCLHCCACAIPDLLLLFPVLLGGAEHFLALHLLIAMLSTSIPTGALSLGLYPCHSTSPYTPSHLPMFDSSSHPENRPSALGMVSGGCDSPFAFCSGPSGRITSGGLQKRIPFGHPGWHKAPTPWVFGQGQVLLRGAGPAPRAAMERLASFSNDPFDKPPCRGCSSYLSEPYVKCAECGPPPFLLCLQCFTRGFEYKKHQSDHTYEIMTSDFPVLDPNWTAQEEMSLLEAVMDCGFGNWQDVANQMCTKSKEECEKHYMKHFINNPLFASTLLNLKQAEEVQHQETAIPFHPADDPPRPTFDSLLSRDMAGYMPARADFVEEFDNYAEWDLRDIDFVEDDSDILHALKIAVVDIYHSRLKERQRRKKIIRDHGLINLRKFQILERRYPKEVQDLYETMRRFARILGPVEHDKFIESHALEFELRREIKRLQEYRAAGITNFCSARTYDHLKKSRDEERLKRTMLSEVLQYIQDSSACQQWLSRQADIDSGLTPTVPVPSTTGRRSAPPLNLTGLPGTEKLNEKEKELCQMVRLVPGAYLEYKAALVNECNKQGGLRLAQARALIKIDVNKTRKIYDFLIREGYITKA